MYESSMMLLTFKTIGHQFGPDTPEMSQALSEVDDMIGSIVNGLNQRNLSDIVNIIVVVLLVLILC